MDDVQKIIFDYLAAVLEKKGQLMPAVSGATEFLSGELDIDSLDLATLVVTLEDLTGRQPFRDGFRDFRTVGELATLFSS
jgi:acyl carrier protein